MDGAARKGVLLPLLLACWLVLGAGASPTPPGAAPQQQDTCTSCGFRRPPEEAGTVDGDFLEAVKRHILSRLQMRSRPNITHAVPKAAMVTALRKLHAGKVRDDGRVEIPSLDGQASSGPPAHEQVSEIISFAETGGHPLALPPSPSGPPTVPSAQHHSHTALPSCKATAHLLGLRPQIPPPNTEAVQAIPRAPDLHPLTLPITFTHCSAALQVTFCLIGLGLNVRVKST